MKQCTRTHNRRRKRREKIIVSNAGLNPADWNFSGETEWFLILTHKRLTETTAVVKPQK